MSDETRRPVSGGVTGSPIGMRARNRTAVLGAEKIDSLRTNVERPAVPEPAAPSFQPEPSVDSSALDIFGASDAASPVESQQNSFQSLDDIFGTGGSLDNQPPASSAASDYHDPFELMAQQDDGGDFAPVLGVQPPDNGGASQSSHPKIVRTAASPGRSVGAAHSEEDVFDPFSAMEDAASAASDDGSPRVEYIVDDLDSMLSDLPGAEGAHEAEAPHVGAPKIVRTGDLGAAHERVIVPPAPQQAAPIQMAPTPPVGMPAHIHEAEKEAETMTETRDKIYWKTESPLVGFLVTYDHDPKGSYVELRQGRLMVSNQREESGSCLVVLGESVSPMHAIMRVGPAGVVQVLDQLSEAGTRVRHVGQAEEEFLSGEKSSVSHGDAIFFGDRKFHVLLVVGEEDTE